MRQIVASVRGVFQLSLVRIFQNNSEHVDAIFFVCIKAEPETPVLDTLYPFGGRVCGFVLCLYAGPASAVY